MPEICMQCGEKMPLAKYCLNCAFYYEEKSANYAECMNKKMEQVPEDIAQKYIDESESCPFYEEATVPGLCSECGEAGVNER